MVNYNVYNIVTKFKSGTFGEQNQIARLVGILLLRFDPPPTTGPCVEAHRQFVCPKLCSCCGWGTTVAPLSRPTTVRGAKGERHQGRMTTWRGTPSLLVPRLQPMQREPKIVRMRVRLSSV